MLMKFVLLSDVRDCDPGFCKRWLGVSDVPECKTGNMECKDFSELERGGSCGLLQSKHWLNK